MNYIDAAIGRFKIFWLPQTISVAENIYSRFMAGEDLTSLCYDYGVSMLDAETAIRFFVLKNKRSPKAKAIYDDWQERRFRPTREEIEKDL